MNSIRLKNRTLWQDGSNTVDVPYLYEKLLNGEDITSLFIETITPEIKIYNQHTNTPLTVKEGINALELNWNIPEEYKKLEIKQHILKKLENEIYNNNFSELEIEQRITRVQCELKLWNDHNMDMLLATLIYIIDQFILNNIVWGTGRGSSCSCYILYLIGLHDVDSIYYNLDIREFFRE